ncbi:MAG: pilus assembly protein PilM, partial [Pseudomonadota bacterium]
MKRAVVEDTSATVPAFSTAQKEESRQASAQLGTRVLCAAATRARVAGLLHMLASRGVEPHSLIAAPTVYSRVAEKIAALAAPEARDEAVLILDVGHSRTNLCIVKKGRTIFARTLSRGGRHVTLAIMREWNIPFEQAERAKHLDGFVASNSEPAPSVSWERISQAIMPEIAPLARDLRQTISACRAQTGVMPKRILLCGGGGRLRGLRSYLAEELALPVDSVAASDAARLVGESAAANGTAADAALVAHGVAMEGATGRPMFDLRQGPLAYRADFSFLRAKTAFFCVATAAILAFAAANVFAARHKLDKEEVLLGQRLKTATTEIFGQPLKLEDVQARLAPKHDVAPQLKASAFDLLVEISSKLPPRDQVKLDVLELDIKPQKITIRAVTDSAKAIDDIESKLKEIECFTEVQRGKVEGSAEEKQFSFTITTKCM